MMLCFFLFNLRGRGCGTRTRARGVSSWSTPWALVAPASTGAAGKGVRAAGRGEKESPKPIGRGFACSLFTISKG